LPGGVRAWIVERFDRDERTVDAHPEVAPRPDNNSGFIR
jgi:hypothetical protein